MEDTESRYKESRIRAGAGAGVKETRSQNGRERERERAKKRENINRSMGANLRHRDVVDKLGVERKTGSVGGAEMYAKRSKKITSPKIWKVGAIDEVLRSFRRSKVAGRGFVGERGVVYYKKKSAIRSIVH